MTNIADTSFDAFRDLLLPSLGEKQRTVLQFLRHHGGAMTNAEIAAALHVPINTITPRIHELRSKELGELVLDAGKRRCTITGSTSHAWKAKNPVLPEAFPKPELKVEKDPAQLL